MIPEQFGQYQLIEPLGCGGMAEVFLARTIGVSGVEKLLAIKRLLPSCCEDQHIIDLLADEARITVQLDHANVVQVFDFGCVDETYYIAMEYVDGIDLKVLAEGPAGEPKAFPVDVSLHVTTAILDGLAFAHGRTGQDGQPLGIIHRDVTPHNVLISRAGQVKLTDFGVARARISNHVSQVGDVRGKYSYMPPEQVCGGELDHRVDIFAVGAILYELLSGKQPFRSASFREQMRLLTREVAPPSQLVEGLPEALDEIVLKALHVDPSRRFDSAQEFARALRRQLEQRFDPATVSPAHKLAQQVSQHLAARTADGNAHGEVMQRGDYDGTSSGSLLGGGRHRARGAYATASDSTTRTTTAAGPPRSDSSAPRTEVMDFSHLAAQHQRDVSPRRTAATPTALPDATVVETTRPSRSVSGEIRAIETRGYGAKDPPRAAGSIALPDTQPLQPIATPTDPTAVRPSPLRPRVSLTDLWQRTSSDERAGLGEVPTAQSILPPSDSRARAAPSEAGGAADQPIHPPSTASHDHPRRKALLLGLLLLSAGLGILISLLVRTVW